MSLINWISKLEKLILSVLLIAASARLRSDHRSSGSSRPMCRRMVSGATPKNASGLCSPAWTRPAAAGKTILVDVTLQARDLRDPVRETLTIRVIDARNERPKSRG